MTKTHAHFGRIALWLGFILIFSPRVSAAPLPPEDPDSQGLSAEQLTKLTERLRAGIASKEIPGAVVLVARHGKIVYFEAVGNSDSAHGKTMQKDAIFRIHSMSKPLTTATALRLLEDGKIALTDPVAKYIPAFADMQVGIEETLPSGGVTTLHLVPAKRPIMIQDLMRHTSGITYGFFGTSMVKAAYDKADLFNENRDNAEVTDRIAHLPLAYQPGTTWDYGHSTDVLGRIIELVQGKSLYAAEKELILDPLDMADTSFYVEDKSKHARIAEPFSDDRGIGLHTEMNDPRIRHKAQSGGSGMVSTAMDYARFLQMILNGGTLDGHRILGPKTIAFMTANHVGAGITTTNLYLPGPGYGYGLGFAVRKAIGEAPYPAEPGTISWGGVGGTYFWADPKTDLLAVLMIQAPKQRAFYRALVHDMIYAAITR